jgi:flagellar biogenesis protein FliO
MSPEATYVLESLATIAVFGGALYFATWGLRRLSGTRGRGPLEILARQPLDGRRAVYLVRVGKRVLIVGASDSALTRLGSTSLASIEKELAADTAPPRSFRDVLSQALGNKAVSGDRRRPKDESDPS